MPGTLGELFDDMMWTTTSVFIKALTTNDDSGRHGVLVPREAYPLFPALEGFGDENPSRPITTYWKRDGTWAEKESFFRQYDRYPERRLTSLEPGILNRPGNRIFAVAKKDDSAVYRGTCVVEGEEGYEELKKSLGLLMFVPGASAVVNIGETTPIGSEFPKLLEDLQEIGAKGWIPTVRKGDTGVGMTLEYELGIDPNVATGPDIYGIELKSSRARNSGKKVTLFAKTPNWGAGGRQALLDEHGYYDEKRDRWALYHSIHGHMESESGWKIEIDRSLGQLFVCRRGEKIVDWDLETLESSLLTKHAETAFVEAQTRGRGGSEEFRFTKVTHAAIPTIERFLSLVEDGRICHDFAMHRTESGTARDHGFLFRITDGFQASLYSYIRTYELG